MACGSTDASPTGRFNHSVDATLPFLDPHNLRRCPERPMPTPMPATGAAKRNRLSRTGVLRLLAQADFSQAGGLSNFAALQDLLCCIVGGRQDEPKRTLTATKNTKSRKKISTSVLADRHQVFLNVKLCCAEIHKQPRFDS